MYLEVALQRYKKAARSFSPTSKAVLCDHIKTVNWRRTLNKFFKQRLQQLLCDCYRIRKEGSKFVTMFVGKFYNCVTNHQAHRPRPFVRDYLSREAILTRKLGVQSQTRLCRTRLKLFGPLHRCDLFLRSFPVIFQRSELWLLEDESQIMFHKTEFESRSSRTFFPFDRCYQSDAA